MSSPKIAVYGANGHTARFIIDRILQRGWIPVLCGRDPIKLSVLANRYPSLEQRVASVDQPALLDEIFQDVTVIVNCAGPFLDTSFPIIESALRLSIHYIDLSAEQKSVQDAFALYGTNAARTKSIIIPALAFYGGLPDLMASAITRDWDQIDEIKIAIGLSSWEPTLGTRLTGQRNHYPRMVYSNKRLHPKEKYSEIEWRFSSSMGNMMMTDIPFSEIITLSSHMDVNTIATYLSTNALSDVRNANTPVPTPSDASGRSDQRFHLDVVASRNGDQRKASATGNDIYAVTAPLVVEGIDRILNGKVAHYGVAAAGHVFAAYDFLISLPEKDVAITMQPTNDVFMRNTADTTP